MRLSDIEYRCVNCGVGNEWNGLPLTLQLDHIDGNHGNNLKENLRWLCPNCHSQTRTFAGKNVPQKRKCHYCVDCGKEIVRDAIRCVNCANKYKRKVIRPSKEDLYFLLKNHNGNFENVGKIYNVNGNTIRKWCISYEIPHHTSDYKIKKEKNKNLHE